VITISTAESVTATFTLEGRDLVVTEVSDPPTVATPGGAFTAIDRVANVGTLDAGAFIVRYYLSPTPERSGDAIALKGARSISVLGAGVETEGSTVVTIPVTAPLGVFYLVSCADDTRKVAETNEANNCLAATAPVLLALPDLATVAVSDPPGSVSPGSKITVGDTVRNVGNATAAQSTTRYYLSFDSTKDATDVLLTGSRTVGELAPGAESSGTKAVTVPSTTPPGTYTLLACADDLKKVVEGSDSNCAAAAATILVGRADLLVADVSAPATALRGAKITVTDVVLNQGNVPAPQSATRYYLATAPVRGTGDILLTGNRTVPLLPGGASSSGSKAVTIPLTTPVGSYSLIACADDTKKVAESDESNNCLAAATIVIQ
jgi:hypothetical protein